MKKYRFIALFFTAFMFSFFGSMDIAYADSFKYTPHDFCDGKNEKQWKGVGAVSCAGFQNVIDDIIKIDNARGISTSAIEGYCVGDYRTSVSARECCMDIWLGVLKRRFPDETPQRHLEMFKEAQVKRNGSVSRADGEHQLCTISDGKSRGRQPLFQDLTEDELRYYKARDDGKIIGKHSNKVR